MTATARLTELIKEQDLQGIIELSINDKDENLPQIIHAKVVACINLEQYQHGYDLIQSSNVQELDFEAAYCLYRLNKLQESYKLLQDTAESYKANKDLYHHMMQLKAQVCYRLEEFDSALQIYANFEMTDDIDTNVVAVEAAKLACSGKSNFLSPKTKTYSSLFNLACFQIANGKFDLALETLEQAKKICQQDMQVDGYEIDDIDRELDILDSQKAYVLQKLGSYQESFALYSELLSKNLDPVMRAIATNNSLTISGSNEIVKVSKALRFINNPSIIAKLNSSQTFFVEYNAMVYSMLVKKKAAAIRKLKSLKDKISIDDPRFDYLLYAELGLLKAKAKSSQISSKEIESFSVTYHKSPAAKLYLLNSLIDLHKYIEAESILSNLLKDECFMRYSQGWTSIYVFVMEKIGKTEKALDIVGKIHGRSAEESKQLAQFKLKLGRYSEALCDFEKIEGTLSPYDQACYLTCLAHCRPLDTVSLFNNLKKFCPSVELKEGIDELPAKLSKEGVSKKVRRKKKKKQPKTYDPKVIPDPNRWLPKVARDRLKDDPSGYQGASTTSGAGMGSTGSAKISGTAISEELPSSGKSKMTKEELTAKLSAAAKKKGKKRK